MAKLEVVDSPKRGKGAAAPEQKPKKKAGRTVGHVFATIGITLLMIVVLVYGALFVLFRGPSPSISRLLTLSFNETSAMYWVPGLFLPQTEVDEILAQRDVTAGDVTNTDLIQIGAGSVSTDDGSSRPAAENGEAVDAFAAADQDGDGIIIEEVSGPMFRGFMMIVQDPSRLTLGRPDTYGDGAVGLNIYDMAKKYNAVAAINAGGFYDPDGAGTGGIPDGLVISEGELAWGSYDGTYEIVGFDNEHRLIVGTMTGQEALDMNVECACTFGPSLIINGVAQNENAPLASGVNPRTAIGQRADGAVLLLVIDGRQVSSPGANYDDLVDIMLEYGAVNASNLDGGSSSMMVYNGELVNTCASVVGPRELATSFVVLPLQ